MRMVAWQESRCSNGSSQLRFLGATQGLRRDARRRASFGDAQPGRVEALSIYEWYEGEFGGFEGVIVHMIRFARPERRRKLQTVSMIDAYDYDWKLYDAARK
jgi:hypothetical protein